MTNSARGMATSIAESCQTPPSKSNSANINPKRIWFDGSTTRYGKGGREGWAVVDEELNILVEGSREESPENSSQRAELRGFLAAIRCVPVGNESLNFHILGDSSYSINLVAQGWLMSWKSKGWKKKSNSKATPANLDLLISIDLELSLRPGLLVQWEKRCTSAPGKLVDAKSRDATMNSNAHNIGGGAW